VPGGYDFARIAWFSGFGATGSALGDVDRISKRSDTAQPLRDWLSDHVHQHISGSPGGIATAFVNGDQGGISDDDQLAMRRSGLAHLLSISGLHVSAVIAAAMFLTMRLLALSPVLALRWRLPLIAAAVGAAAGIGYTLLTGAQVPTVRSCVAALLVIGGLALGREALTMRLVASGALVILLILPDALIGPSFQLSFAAIAGLIAFNEIPAIKRFNAPREEGRVALVARATASLIMTGIAVELVLAPIALYHFQRTGLYGALANIIAIPLSTFIVMPLEALALLFDTVGIGQPFWWLTEQSLRFLIWLAHMVAAQPGSVLAIPSEPVGAFALMTGGGLWLILWKTRLRLFGLAPLVVGMIWTLSVPPPDLVVTGDGRHLAVRTGEGHYALLRSRAGDYVRDVLAQRGGTTSDLDELDAMPGARCSDDACLVDLTRGGRHWRILATRSAYRLPWAAMTTACAQADIVISDRRLPRGCVPQWIKADRALLRETGGLAITLAATPTVDAVNTPGDEHPWRLDDRSDGFQ
jgi:competence protein ComEC